MFLFDNQVVEIVDSFSYLDLLMFYNGKFNTTQKHIANQAKNQFSYY